MLSQQLIPQDLAGLAAPGHRIDIEICKCLLADIFGLVAVGEACRIVLKHRLEEIVMYILSP